MYSTIEEKEKIKTKKHDEFYKSLVSIASLNMPLTYYFSHQYSTICMQVIKMPKTIFRLIAVRIEQKHIEF
jgi:hypothetical protein